MLTAVGRPTEDVFQVIFSIFSTSHTHTTIPAGSAALQARLFCTESHPVKHTNYNEHAINDHLRKVVSILMQQKMWFFSLGFQPFQFLFCLQQEIILSTALSCIPTTFDRGSQNGLGWK